MTSDEICKLIEVNELTLHGDIEHFAALVASAEREACAKVCDELWEDDYTAFACAEAIRARGQA
jgi:DNA-binding protein YbaB